MNIKSPPIKPERIENIPVQMFNILDSAINTISLSAFCVFLKSGLVQIKML